MYSYKYISLGVSPLHFLEQIHFPNCLSYQRETMIYILYTYTHILLHILVCMYACLLYVYKCVRLVYAVCVCVCVNKFDVSYVSIYFCTCMVCACIPIETNCNESLKHGKLFTSQINKYSFMFGNGILL